MLYDTVPMGRYFLYWYWGLLKIFDKTLDFLIKKGHICINFSTNG